MTEQEARDWFIQRLGVSRETLDRLAAFAASVIEENERQNLISAASVPYIWSRHIVDSAQLLTHATRSRADGLWLDLGTGAGFPGMIVGILADFPVVLVESRRKRFTFLEQQAAALGLAHVQVHCGRLEQLESLAADTISARAFAPLGRLFEVAHRFSTEKTQWLLPKGRSVREELESIAGSWQGNFRVEPSITDDGAAIIVASEVRPRKRSR